jgi:tuberous sclerosis protein 2
MASLVSTSLKNPKISPYANNWLERLRKIKLLKNRIMKESSDHSVPVTTAATTSTTSFLKDVFTKYT